MTTKLECENGTATITLTEKNGEYTVTTISDGFLAYEETTPSRKQAERWVAAEIKMCKKQLS